MSDRTKHFVTENKEADEAEQKRQRDARDAADKANALDALYASEARIFESAFLELRDEFRADDVNAYVLPGSKTYRAYDPNTTQESAGPALVTLTYSTAKNEYEIALLRISTPSDLSVLCWRKGRSGKVYKTLETAVSPQAVVSDPALAVAQINRALDEIKLGD